VLTPEVIARTLDLLEARQIAVTPDPVRLSLSDTLLDRLRIDPSVNPGSQEVVVRYRTAARDEAATVLAALLDAVVEVSRSQSLTQEMTAASAADEAELAQFDDAVARQRLLVNAAQSRVQEFSIEQAALRASQEKLKSLGQAAAEVQRRRIEAESRFRQAEQDVASGIPAELLAARLPAGELRTVVTELFAREDRRREIAEGQARLQQLAKVYGRNHPALQEVQTRLQQLAREVADAAESNGGLAGTSRGQLLLEALRSAWSEAQASEDDLQSELAAETRIAETEQAATRALSEHQSELAFLESERARVQQRLEKRRRALAAGTTTILHPPALAPEPVSSGSWPSLLLGGGVGCVCCVSVLWSAFRRRRREKDLSSPLQARASYRRFLSHEERQLVRMKSAATTS
jgi:hypothetical protein